VLINTTCTAANLNERVRSYLCLNSTETHADVAENTSINLPSVINHKQAEKIAVKVDTSPKRTGIVFMTYKTTIAEIGKRDATIVPMNAAIL
jgi:hypothetical protein